MHRVHWQFKSCYCLNIMYLWSNNSSTARNLSPNIIPGNINSCQEIFRVNTSSLVQSTCTELRLRWGDSSFPYSRVPSTRDLSFRKAWDALRSFELLLPCRRVAMHYASLLKCTCDKKLRTPAKRITFKKSLDTDVFPLLFPIYQQIKYNAVLLK